MLFLTFVTFTLPKINFAYPTFHSNIALEIQSSRSWLLGFWIEGKHNPITWRNHHEAQVGGKMRGEQVPHNDVLPIVMIKDPISWMSSLCRHPYSARWRHYKICPNLVPNEFDKGRKPGEGTMGVIV